MKLLVSELQFQCQQPNAEEYLPAQEDDNDDGWEDMDDIGVLILKTKSYINDDENMRLMKD